MEFLGGDTFGFRTLTSPSRQFIVDNPAVTCARRGLAAVVPFESCAKVHLHGVLCAAIAAFATASAVVVAGMHDENIIISDLAQTAQKNQRPSRFFQQANVMSKAIVCAPTLAGACKHYYLHDAFIQMFGLSVFIICRKKKNHTPDIHFLRSWSRIITLCLRRMWDFCSRSQALAGHGRSRLG